MKRKNIHSEEFKRLFGKFQAGNISLKELDTLEKLMNDEDSSDDIRRMMMDDLADGTFSKSLIEPDTEKMYAQIRSAISTQKNKRRNIILFNSTVRVAAVLALAFLLGSVTTYLTVRNNKAGEDAAFCEVTAPLGGKSEIVLPDNSKVWLNAGSKIRYSTSFNKKDRNIALEGEGYFKVAKNKALPFIVDALGFKVKAVGTEFNVKAYKNEGTVETTLVEGKVELITASQKNSESVYMEPNQKAIYVKDHQKLDIEELKREKPNMAEIAPVNKEADLLMTPPINIQSQVSWVNDRLIVEREPLSELAVRLSRKYNFTFVFKSEDIKRYRFSGTLEDETLQQVMDVIKLTSPIDYEISGKTVIIDKNENRQKKFEPYLKN